MKTRPHPVSASFLHSWNDAYIVISSSMIENEISVFLKALEIGKKDIQEPDNDMVLPQLAEQFALLTAENVLPPEVGTLRRQIHALELDQKSLGVMVFRLYQLSRLIREQKRHHLADTYLVPPNWNRRWFELMCGRVLFADVIDLNADAFQP